MKNLIRTFLHSLHDRIIGSIGSMIGATFSTYRVVHEAEQKSFLEDLARQYEAEGKPQLAKEIRLQSDNLKVDDPGGEALPVFRNLLADQSELPMLCDDQGNGESTSDTDTAPTPSKKKRRGRKPSPPADDMGVSLD